MIKCFICVTPPYLFSRQSTKIIDDPFLPYNQVQYGYICILIWAQTKSIFWLVLWVYWVNCGIITQAYLTEKRNTKVYTILLEYFILNFTFLHIVVLSTNLRVGVCNSKQRDCSITVINEIGLSSKPFWFSPSKTQKRHSHDPLLFYSSVCKVKRNRDFVRTACFLNMHARATEITIFWFFKYY